MKNTYIFVIGIYKLIFFSQLIAYMTGFYFNYESKLIFVFF